MFGTVLRYGFGILHIGIGPLVVIPIFLDDMRFKEGPAPLWYGDICLYGDLKRLAEEGIIPFDAVPEYCRDCQDPWDHTCPKFYMSLFDSRRNKDGRDVY